MWKSNAGDGSLSLVAWSCEQQRPGENDVEGRHDISEPMELASLCAD